MKKKKRQKRKKKAHLLCCSTPSELQSHWCECSQVRLHDKVKVGQVNLQRCKKRVKFICGLRKRDTHTVNLPVMFIPMWLQSHDNSGCWSLPMWQQVEKTFQIVHWKIKRSEFLSSFHLITLLFIAFQLLIEQLRGKILSLSRWLIHPLTDFFLY